MGEGDGERRIENASLCTVYVYVHAHVNANATCLCICMCKSTCTYLSIIIIYRLSTRKYSKIRRKKNRFV